MMRVQMTELSPERIRFWGDGDEHVLAPIMREGLQLMTGLVWDMGHEATPK